MADENILPRDQNHVTTAGFENSLSAGDVRPGQIVVATGRIKVDASGGGSGTVTQIDTVSPISGGPITTTGTITTSMATNKLIGRGTSGTGVMEQITLGTNLSLSGTTLNAAGLTTLTVGSTTITSGTNTRILYDNSGVLGEYTLTGSGTVVAMQTSPNLTTPTTGANGGTGGSLKFFGSTSGDVTVKVAVAAGTSTVFQLPATNGTDTYVLQTNGSGITSWVPQTGGGGGTPGSPTSSIQFNNTGSFGGSSTLLFDGTGLITFGAENDISQLTAPDAVSANTAGGSIEITSGAGLGSGAGGDITIAASAAGATGTGGNANVNGGSTTTGNGGSASLQGGSVATSGNGGNVSFFPGQKGGGGTDGHVTISDPTSTISAIFNTATLASTDKTFTFPNASGTFALTTGGALALTVGTTTITSGTTTRILYDNSGTLGEYTLTGTGTVVVMATSPTFTTGATTPQLLATANDSGALGASGTAFADLFLASGGVINWAANNANITHSTGILTVGAGEFRITSANVGTNADSVPTLSSTSTFTNKTLTTPVINGASTGTGVASAATASTLMQRDSNANTAVNNIVEGFTTTATAASTTTLTITATYTQVFTGSSTQTVKLPTTSVLQGQQYYFINQSTGAVTVQSSGANTIVILAAGTSGLFTAVVATPTTAANWGFNYYGEIVTSAKSLSVSNTLTLAGTDGTTMTFPTSSKTIAANDGSNWTIASQAIGDLAYASSTTAYSRIAAVAVGSVLVSAGTGTQPVWSAGPQVTTIELGSATDTTIARVSGGQISVEGVQVVTLSNSVTMTNKVLTAPSMTTVAETGIGTADLLAPNNHTITVSSNAGSASQSFLLNTFTNSSAATMAITIPVATPTPKDGQFLEVRIYDFSAVAQTIGWTGTENSTVSAPTTSNGSTTLPLSVLFQFNNATTKWRCIASA